MAPFVFRRRSIRPRETLGRIFETTRMRLGVTLTDAERSTRVRAKYLEALETGQFDQLPEAVYALGFVRRYAEFLDLDPRSLTNQFRQEEIAQRKLGLPAPEAEPNLLAINQGPRQSQFVITPKLFWVSASCLLILTVFSYLWWQIQGFMAAPQLAVDLPGPELVVSSPTIEIAGVTEGNAYLTINAEPVAIDPQGNFKQEVRLEPGVNTIEVAAKNRLNKETKQQIRVLTTYQEPEGQERTFHDAQI